jgi:hypothetical protein
VLRNSSLIVTVVPMPAPSQSFKIILERVLWYDLQSCGRINPDVINVIKMPSFSIFSLFSGTEKCHWGLDPVNSKGVPAQLFVH